MSRRIYFAVVFGVFLLCLAGCGSKSDKVQGVWKDTRGKDLIHTGFVEIGKDYFVLNGKRENGIVLVDIDGVVMVQTAGTRKDIMRLILHEDDTLTIEMPLMGKQKFTRSSKEELEIKEKAIAEAKEIARKKFAAVSGVWKEKDAKSLIETDFLEIQTDYIVINGERIDDITLKINNKNNQVAVDRGVMYGITMKLTPKDSDTIIVHLRSNGDKEFVKSSHEEIKAKEKAIAEAEEAARKKAEAERLAREKKASDVCGVWKEQGVSDLVITEFIEIRKDYAVISGRRIDKVKLEANNDNNEVLVETGYISGMRNIVVELENENTLLLRIDRNIERKFSRSSNAELEAKEKAITARYDQLINNSYGTWVKMKDEDSYNNSLNSLYQVVEISKDSLTVNNETQPIHFSRLEGDSDDPLPFYPAVGYADQPNSYFFGIRNYEGDGKVMVTFTNNWGRNEPKYIKTSAENVELHNHPSLANIKGGWLKEGDSKEGYNLVAFSNTVFYRDGNKIEITSKTRDNSPVLSIKVAHYSRQELCEVVQFSKDMIKVKYDNSKVWLTYHKLSNAEAKNEMKKYTDEFEILDGFWKSEKPVEDGKYLYYAIMQKQKDGDDTIDKLYSIYEKGERVSWVKSSKGYFDYNTGKENWPICIKNDYNVYYPNIIIVDKNTIKCNVDSNRKGITFRRISPSKAPEKLIEEISNE